jgi:Phage P22-like portal protein
MTDNILSTARQRLTTAIAAYSDTRDSELDDLKFYAGSPDNKWQWPQDVLNTRGSVQGQSINARPCLTVNKLPQHVKQITNDIRMNRPAGKVIPADDKADVKIAEILQGVIRHIEYISDADVAYDTACENQVTMGEGYVRLITEYCGDDSFDQDIKICRVRNSFSVYLDPMCQDPCGQDAEWALITTTVTKEEFEQRWPKAKPVSNVISTSTGDQSLGLWATDKTVRIAEYFYADYTPVTLHLYPNNQTVKAGTPQDKMLAEVYGKPMKTRVSQQRVIKWCKLNGFEILESSDWVGKYIPIVRFMGNDFEVEGNLYYSGIVRNAKDAQRMYNYWVSQEAEMLALAPKAPFIGYGGQFEGYEDKWKTANVQNWPYLEVNPDVTDGEGRVLPLPQRAQPPMASSGLLQAKAGASEDVKAATGQYDASLGMHSNERSGKAILARQKEGDTGTYHYTDNAARAVRYITRQLIDIIPKIYDTERVARIIGEDGEASTVKFNPEQPEAVRQVQDPNNPSVIIETIYNPSIGKYDAIASSGPSYATKREQSMEAMAQILQGNPELWRVAGDLFVKNMDWPGADQLASRLARTVDPALVAEEDTSPAFQAAQLKIQEMGQQLDQLHQMLQNVRNSEEVRTNEIKEFEAQIKAYSAETQRMAAMQSGMSPEQIQEIVLGTVHGMIDMGDLIAEMPSHEMPSEEQPYENE